jgi:Holliday junction resolvasome RuvABC DNA-binding subunit
LERLRSKARHDEAQALAYERRKAREEVLALVEQGYSSAEIKERLGF